MNIRLILILFISTLSFAQENAEQVEEIIITDLDRLVESVKKTASTRSVEDRERLQKFISNKNRQQTLLRQMKAQLDAEKGPY